MNKNTTILKFLITSAILATILICSFMFNNTLGGFGKANQIHVRGVSEQILVSDRVNWRLRTAVSSSKAEWAKRDVDKSIAYAVEYLVENGVPEELIHYSVYAKQERTKTVYLDNLGNKEEEFIGYNVSRSIYVKGFDNVELIEKLYGVIELDFEKKELYIFPESPYYYYSQPVADIKVDLIKKASQNARERAEIIAENMGGNVGNVIQARQGSFNGFGDDGFGSSGYVGGNSKEHILNAQVSATFQLKK